MDSSHGEGFRKIIFQKMCPSVRPGAHSPRTGRFSVTKNDEVQEETYFILDLVSPLKSVDSISQKGVDTQNAPPFVNGFFS